MIYTEIQLSTKPIILVMGKLCSGKGRFSERYANIGYAHITTSDVVKSVSGAQSRSDLQQTSHFDTLIASEMIGIIRTNPLVVIDGIRQLSILRLLESEFPDDIKSFWLDVPEYIRRSRFDNRGATKDDKSFDDAQIGDHNLGLTELEQYLRSRSQSVNHV